MNISYQKANNDYLNWLVRTYPMNDYKRVKPLTKKEKFKRFLRKVVKVAEISLYAVSTVITIAAIFVMAGVIVF